MKFKEIKPGMVIHCPTEEDARVLIEQFDKLGYKWETGKPISPSYCTEWYRFGADTHYFTYIDKTISYKHTLAINHDISITEFSDLIESDNSSVGSLGNWVQKINAHGLLIGYKCRYCGQVSQNHSKFCQYCGKDMYDGSPINSDTDSPMSAAEALEWFAEADCHILAEIFDGWRDVDDILGQFTAKEIVDKITAYEAAKKAQKPVEVEYGWYFEIFRYATSDEILDYKEMWGVDKDTAEKKAAEKAKQYVMKHGGQASYNVCGICRAKEGES